MTIERARELLEQKKEQGKEEDKEKISVLNTLFKDDNIFFQVNMQTAYGILEFLGVDKARIDQEYEELISPTEYNKHRAFIIKGEEK